ncbi:MAG: hypothetical protein IJD10_06185 [Clostridia bacterium]|nr:hypothetical protein [Clostridia bacterium]
MIWIICAILSTFMLVLSMKAYLNKNKGSLRVILILLCLFIASYIIYLPAFLASYDFLSGTIGNFIHVLQIVTIDADIMEYYDLIHTSIGNAIFTKIYMLLLGVLHITMPAVSALTAITVLFRCFSSMQLGIANRRKKPMFVFSEVNECALQLAKSLESVKCDIVFSNSSDESLNNTNDSVRGYIFKEESISDLRIKSGKRKDVYFFCISEDEDKSLSHALQLIDHFSNLSDTEQEHIHIYHFSKHQDFSVYIDSADKGMLDVQCINEYEMLVYHLLDKYPLFRFAKSDIHVLLYGFSDINRIALKAIAWCGQLSGFSMRISVVGVDINDKIHALKLDAPGLFTDRYQIDFYDCRSDKEITDIISQQCSDANYIIVSDDSDNNTMNRGIMLRRLFYRLSKTYDYCPPIFCYIKEPAKYEIVKNLATAEFNPKRKMSYDLIPFGSLSEVYSYKQLVDSDLEKLAKNVHLAYEEIFSSGEINVKEAIKNYNVFAVNKRSNRANALHIRYKLNLLGLDYCEEDEARSVTMSDYYTEESLKKLSLSEHDRWMAFLETEGWIPATKEDVYAYRESGISKGRHNCPILKMHPYICEYENLKDLSMDLEGKDTTVYDEELILRIPDILGDKWNVAGKKFTIITLE